jgi:hypothetical protein
MLVQVVSPGRIAMKDSHSPLQEASVSGPGSIAAQEGDGRARPVDSVPPMAQPAAHTPAVGTPGASDQTNPTPPVDGLSGAVTNDQLPSDGAVIDADRTPPDMEEAMPDPRGDARDPRPPR